MTRDFRLQTWRDYSPIRLGWTEGLAHFVHVAGCFGNDECDCDRLVVDRAEEMNALPEDWDRTEGFWPARVWPMPGWGFSERVSA